ncbi:MAG: ABC transporter ATP-binding protein [Melioribacteraceae bacterium]|nr:ABC transporter ATP-binding protein [Melioribacteraceae bacterium]
MNSYNLSLNNVTKIFGRRLVFKKISFEMNSGNIYGVSGNNGSGKSTLAKIIAGVISTSSGKIEHMIGEKKIIPEELHDHLGFVSPYLFLYDEFNAEENLYHFAKIRGINPDNERIERLFELFNLADRKKDLLKGYSSGMKQRMKFIFALQHSPRLLIFDEPTSNLDNKGKAAVYQLIEEESKDNLVIVASNEDSDLELCTSVIDVEQYKKK